MARIAQDKVYRSFANGLVTEATELTFPPDSLRDIVNCDININGSVRRRLGLTEESGGTVMHPGSLIDLPWENRLAGPFSVLPDPSTTCAKEELAVTVHVWPSPAGQQDLAFVIFQVGNLLYIRDWASNAVSDVSAMYPYVVGSLEMRLDYEDTGFIYKTDYLSAAKVQLQSAVGMDRIWFTSEAVIPFFIEYRPATKTLFCKPVGWDEDDPAAEFGQLLMRDFNGLEDGLKPDEQPTVYTAEHRYNLYNQGWTDTLIADYETSQSKYPSNSQQWVLGKDENEDFDPTILAKQDFGTSLAPKGRGILNVLTGNRDNIFPAWDMGNIYDDPSLTSFRTCAFYAGRLWLAGDVNNKRSNSVYFSKVIAKPKDAGVMMQENDPTSEHFPDLLATDGGVIPVAEAAGITKLLPFGQGLLVMARNGIWFIYGGEGGFRADNFSVEKVSSTGVLSASSIVEADQQIAFLAENSIHALVFPERGYLPTIIDLAAEKIFTVYNRVPVVARAYSQGCYDPRTKKIFWSYEDVVNQPYNFPAFQSRFNRMFVLDTRTGAFTIYRFEIDAGFLANSVVFPKRGNTRPEKLDNVVAGIDGQVTVDGEDVVAFRDAGITQPSVPSIKVVFMDGSREGLRLCEFFDTSFMDYATIPDFPTIDYESHIQTGDELLDDLMRNKQATYLHSFFDRTETGVEYDGDGNLVYENPSGCIVQARWDWQSSGAGGRWSNPQQAYRYRRPFQPVDADDTVDTGDGIVYTKLKIRGKGRALSIRYSSVSGKDFQLLGYAIPFTANGV